jgi:hypothetical protein
MTELTNDSVPEFRVEINPRPTEVERDALVAALAVVLSMATREPAVDIDEAPPSRWARAGRDAAFANRELVARRLPRR